jgi:hydrogenase maturation factor
MIGKFGREIGEDVAKGEDGRNAAQTMNSHFCHLYRNRWQGLGLIQSSSSHLMHADLMASVFQADIWSKFAS